MTKIILHRASTDNAGKFLDAGTEIVVGPADDHLHADRAAELLDTHGAVEVTAAANPASKPPVKKAKAKKATAKPTPAPSPAPASVTEPVRDPVVETRAGDDSAEHAG
jgi:hypothetical protein